MVSPATRGRGSRRSPIAVAAGRGRGPRRPPAPHRGDRAHARRGLLAALPDDALVVNAGRGRLVDQEALHAELASGRLRAVLDVTDPEPLPAGHPLRTAPNVLTTPHIAGDSPRFLSRAYDLVRDQLERHAAGRELVNVVSEGC